MIYATVNMTIGDYSSTCDNKILLYRGDKNVEIRFVLKGNKFTVLNSTYAQMIITRPSTTSIFSEIAPIQNDTVMLTISEDMIDELTEVGCYDMQIRLYDDSMKSRVTIPPAEKAIEVREPIAIDESFVDTAMAGYAMVQTDSEYEEDKRFDENGNYIKTYWEHGDIITAGKLNKVEDSLEAINANDIQNHIEVNEKIDSLVESIDAAEYVTETELNKKGYLTEHQDISGKADKTEIPTKTSQLTNDSGFLTQIPNEYVTETELNAKGYLTKHQDISGKADKTELPTKTSQLTNDNGFLTQIPSEYVTETELNAKGYLTKHQDISGKADKTELHNHTNKSVLDGITASKVSSWNNKSDFDGDYNSLTNKPSIPSIEGLATENYVDEKLEDIDLTSYVKTVNGVSPNEDGNVTITATLEPPTVVDSIEEMVDINKSYVLSTDGFIYSYRKTIIPSSTIPNFTNLANTDGTDWMVNQRLSTTSISDSEGMSITNAFSSKKGDTIYVKNLDLYQFKTSYHRFGMWLNETRVNKVDGASLYYLHKNGYMNIDDNGVTSFKLIDAMNGTDFSSDFNTVRLGVATPTDFSNVIITVNEPITYTITEERYEYAWTNTGISYTPNDYSKDIIEIKSDIDNLENSISSLGGSPVIPSYWTEELETKIDIIQQTMESIGRNKSSFYWYTDAHWQHNAKKSPILLNHLMKNTPINKVNFGGDIVGDPNPYDHENIKSFYDWQKAITDIPNHHSVYGNHDLNHWSTDVHNMSYSLVLAHEESDDMVVSKIDGCYYIDNPSEKTRYLYISYLTKSQTDMMTQGQFIVDGIKSAKSGWHIIVIAHRWFQYSKSSTPTIGSVPAYESEILSVLDAYNMRATRDSSNYFYEQDFTKCKGVVEFCIGGHIHVDYDFTSPGGIPIIITASDTNQERAGEEDEDCGSVGTITEQALYSIIADYENRKVHVIGIGRGGSRELPLLEIEIGVEDDVEESYIKGNCKVAYGTCSTEAATAEKTVVVEDTNWELEVGSMVAIRFSVSNSASNVTINVNGTGAYPIWASAAEYTSASTNYTGYANRTYTYMFNGTHWVWMSNGVYPSSTTNASLGHGYGVCSTAEATLAKACTISSYTLSVGGSVSVKFTNAVPANSTLDIRTRGAKKIFYKGAAISDGVIKAGDTATFVYDGTQYQLISIDSPAFNGDYNSLTNKPNIPSTEGLATEEYVDSEIDALEQYVKDEIDKIENRVEALEWKSSISGGGSSEASTLPDYWISRLNDIGDKIDTLQKENGMDTLQFLWCSDIHGVPGTSPSNTTYIGEIGRYMMDKHNIPFFMVSGDIMSQASHSSTNSIWAEYDKLIPMLSPINNEEFLAIRGNHDGVWGSPMEYNGQTNQYYHSYIGDKALFNAFMRRQTLDRYKRVFGKDGMYFYVDYHNYRIYMLNSHTFGDDSVNEQGQAIYNGFKQDVFGSKQLQWVADTLMTVKYNQQVIFTSHAPINYMKDMYVFANMLIAYRNRTNYTNTTDVSGTFWASGTEYSTSTVTKDFTDAKGDFVGHFNGHIHIDKIEMFGNIPTFSITCAGGDVRDSYYTDGTLIRTKGTATETAIDLVTVTSEYIYFTRIGSGYDRKFNRTTNEITIDYDSAYIPPEEPEESLTQGEITDEIIWHENTRLSSGGGYSEQSGVISSSDILVEKGNVIRIYGMPQFKYYSNVYSYNKNGGLLSTLNIDFDYASSGITGNTAANTDVTASLDDNKVLTITILNDEVYYIRASNHVGANIPTDIRISRNAELIIDEPEEPEESLTQGEITDQVTWMADTRLSSSSANYSAQGGIHASNDILVENGDIIRIYGATTWKYYGYVNGYSASGFLINMDVSTETGTSSTNNYYTVVVDENMIMTITITHSNVSYIRVCGSGLGNSSVRVSRNLELS